MLLPESLNTIVPEETVELTTFSPTVNPAENESTLTVSKYIG